MQFASIRRSLNLSQEELSILFGVPVGSIKNWEQSLREPDSAAITLYKMVVDKDQDVLVRMATIACQKKYTDLKDIGTLKKMIIKIVKNDLLRSLLEDMILKSNPQWTPQELGFRVTEIRF